MEVGDNLNPQRSYKKDFALKGLTPAYHKNKQPLYYRTW